MPIPFLLWGAAALAGAIGIGKGIEASENNAKAKEYIDDAQNIFDDAKYRLEVQQGDTANFLESLGKTKLFCWSNTIGNFINLFGKFKNVCFENAPNIDVKLQNLLKENNLNNMVVASLKAQEVVKGGIGALSTGALAGIASYGGAMMFASASTGTAIASLSGVAATNATLAWLGGGSLAAGGFEMAGGVIALGGIMLGPVFAVAGFLMAAKSEENLAEAKQHYQEARNAVEKMETIISLLSSISRLSNLYESFISKFGQKIDNLSKQVQEIYEREYELQRKSFANIIRSLFFIKTKVDYRLLSIQDQKLLQIYCLSAQVLNAVLATPLLDEQGNLQESAEETLNSAQRNLSKIL
jgi:hypothetical protein